MLSSGILIPFFLSLWFFSVPKLVLREQLGKEKLRWFVGQKGKDVSLETPTEWGPIPGGLTGGHPPDRNVCIWASSWGRRLRPLETISNKKWGCWAMQKGLQDLVLLSVTCCCWGSWEVLQGISSGKTQVHGMCTPRPDSDSPHLFCVCGSSGTAASDLKYWYDLWPSSVLVLITVQTWDKSVILKVLLPDIVSFILAGKRLSNTELS